MKCSLPFAPPRSDLGDVLAPDWSTLARVVVLSAHSDDAAFSLAGTLDAIARRGPRVVIVTCFNVSAFTRAVTVFPVDRVTALRQREDAAYAATLGPHCSSTWLDQLDAPLRGVDLCMANSKIHEHSLPVSQAW
jgi:LmbE family N-acetylglucosaminyl deacetylase